MDKEKSRENKDKGLEKIRKQKIEERLNKLEKQNQQVKQQNKELKKEVEQLRTQSNTLTNTKTSNKRISRRQFLKKAGLGTAGLAALMSPVSSLDVRSDSFGVFTEENQDNPYFSIDNGGPVNIQNTHLDLNNRGIRNVGVLELPRSEASSDHRIWLDTTEEKLKVKIGGKLYSSEIRPAIPDSAIEQYDVSQDDRGGSISSIPGQIGGFDLSGSVSITEVNGDKAYRFDGTEEMQNGNISTTTEPYAVIFVGIQQGTTASNNFYFGTENATNAFSLQDNDSDNLEVARNASGGTEQALTVGPATNEEHVYIVEAEENGGIRLERDGNELGTATQDETLLDGFCLANRTSADDFALQVDYREVVILEDYSEDDLDAERNRLASKWDGVTLD